MADAWDPMRLYGCLTVDLSPMIYNGGPARGTIPAIPAEHFQLGYVLIPGMW